MAGDLAYCSRRGLGERFDSTIGAASVLMPYGGARQRTPAQAMAAKLPVQGGATNDCSVMSYAFDPYYSSADPYRGAYLAVLESVARLAASGAPWRGAHLTFQEYFERLREEPTRWGKPLAALLGALDAQMDLGVAAIGGKDSMSGSFEDLDVPPTLVSFAIAMADARRVASPEFKAANHRVALLTPKRAQTGLPDAEDFMRAMDTVVQMLADGRALSAWVTGRGGAIEAILKMRMGNALGFESANDEALLAPCPCAFVLEMADGQDEFVTLGRTTDGKSVLGVPADELEAAYEGRLESVYPTRPARFEGKAENARFEPTKRVVPRARVARPRVLIPVFPGTNCEYDSARAFERAGAKVDVMVVNNLSAEGVRQSAERFAALLASAQILFLPGGFSGGDEPDGSGKFITAFLRNPLIRARVAELLDARDGLIGGICNGFQALVKLGLLPYGEIRETTENDPTLTYNTIGRHQSKLVRVRVASTLSPWLARERVGEVRLLPVSHGEGRFIATNEALRRLIAGGQIATQYADENGDASMCPDDNPNGATCAIEGITSPDGRVFGRMAHAERIDEDLYRNVPGEHRDPMFSGAIDYFA